ncbi:MAG TPA: copper-binding protein [Thermoleophilaceae bacterium]
MKRLVPSCAAAIALLGIPAAASAQTGVVLRVNRAHHKLEIVDAGHVVRSYTARPGRRAARKVRAGVKVSFQATGGRITSLRVAGRARKLAFLGKVVSNGSKGVVLRLGDGQDLRLGKRRFGKHRAHHSSVQINLQGLNPGQVVLITETTDSAGDLTITIKLVPGADPNGDDQDVTGTITAIGAGSVTIQADDGSTMTFQADAVLLEGFEVGDQVDVTYYADAGGSLVADDIEPVDDGSGAEDLDALGTVTALDAGAGTITVQVDGGGPMTFQADADLLDGVAVGDYVDVTYFQDTHGSLVADDVEPADTSGADGSGD